MARLGVLGRSDQGATYLSAIRSVDAHVFIADLRMRARLEKMCEERFIRLVCLNIEAFWDPLAFRFAL
jgi:hypothetical protein